MASSVGRNPLRSVLEEAPRRQRGPVQLVKEVFGELQKVTWPTREEAMRLTGLVFAVATTIGIILGLWDFGFSQLVNRLLI